MPSAGGQGGSSGGRGSGGSGQRKGFWLVNLGSKGYGVVYGTPQGQGQWAFLGSTLAQAKQNWDSVIHATGWLVFLETPVGTLNNVVSSSLHLQWWTPSNGPANAPSPSDLTAASAFLAGLGWVLADAAGAAGAATAGEGAAAGGAAAGGGGAAAAAKSALSAVASNAKTALYGASLAAIFTHTSLWAGVGMVIAGAVLVLLGILGMSGISSPAAVARKAAGV